MVNEAFRESRCGGNLPQGWVIWRIYVIKTNGNYIPVLLKDLFSSKTMFNSVIEDWLLYACPGISNKNNGTEQRRRLVNGGGGGGGFLFAHAQM